MELIRVDTYIPILRFNGVTRVDISFREIGGMRPGPQATNTVTWTILEYYQWMLMKSCFMIGCKVLICALAWESIYVVDLKVKTTFSCVTSLVLMVIVILSLLLSFVVFCRVYLSPTGFYAHTSFSSNIPDLPIGEEPWMLITKTSGVKYPFCIRGTFFLSNCLFLLETLSVLCN